MKRIIRWLDHVLRHPSANTSRQKPDTLPQKNDECPHDRLRVSRESRTRAVDAMIARVDELRHKIEGRHPPLIALRKPMPSHFSMCHDGIDPEEDRYAGNLPLTKIDVIPKDD